MFRHRPAQIAILVLLLSSSAFAGNVPRSARLAQEEGTRALSMQKYSDAIDAYFQALRIRPDFAEAHYNLGVAFLKGYRAYDLAAFHFGEYLRFAPLAEDRDDVTALRSALDKKGSPPSTEDGRVLGLVGGRLLISGSEWVQQDAPITLKNRPGLDLRADVLYPSWVLTQRMEDENGVRDLEPSSVALAAGQEL